MFRVIGCEDFDDEFQRLRRASMDGNRESAMLVKLIEKGVEKLKYNYRYGQHISKYKIQAEYKEKYGVQNLWKINLSSFWRLIYTIHGSETEVVTSILIEVLDHKKYDRKFGYKTS